MSDSTDDRKEEIKLQLAETIMKTIPAVPDDIHDRSPEEQDRIFKMIDERADRVMALLGSKPTRGAGRRPTGVRRSERFNTPELDVGIRRKPGRPRKLEEE